MRQPLVDRRPGALARRPRRQQQPGDGRQPHERSDRSPAPAAPSAHCAGSVPGAMISDQYRKPVRNTRTAMSIATVIGGFRLRAAMRPGHQRDERQRRPAQLQDDVPLEPGQRHRREAPRRCPADLADEPERRPRRRSRPRTRPDARATSPRRRQHHGERRQRRQQQRRRCRRAGVRDAFSPRARTSADVQAGVHEPAMAQFIAGSSDARQAWQSSWIAHNSAVSICARCSRPLKST